MGNINMTNHVTNLVVNDDRRQGIGKCEDNDQMESISGTENDAKIDNEESKSSEKKKNTNTIAAIDKTSVHKICSGQVILNLGTALKELLENSVDAGATSVEIRLRDYGATSFEVVD